MQEQRLGYYLAFGFTITLGIQLEGTAIFVAMSQLPDTWQACVQTVEHIVNAHIYRACLSTALIIEDGLCLPSTFQVSCRGTSTAEPKSHAESYLQRSLRNVAFSLPAPAMCMVVVGREWGEGDRWKRQEWMLSANNI